MKTKTHQSAKGTSLWPRNWGRSSKRPESPEKILINCLKLSNRELVPPMSMSFSIWNNRNKVRKSKKWSRTRRKRDLTSSCLKSKTKWTSSTKSSSFWNHDCSNLDAEETIEFSTKGWRRLSLTTIPMKKIWCPLRNLSQRRSETTDSSRLISLKISTNYCMDRNR